MTVPLLILGHRGDQFIHDCIASIRENLSGDYYVIVADDTPGGSFERHPDGHVIPSTGGGRGYLRMMSKIVFPMAAMLSETWKSPYAMLWEEDFLLTKPVDIADMVKVMKAPGNERLAQLNLQRQAVYLPERMHGYLASHQRRGYRLEQRRTAGVDWVRRARPFTTNPSLIRREVLEVEWPTRGEADSVGGGAEPAMSTRLEQQGWHFGWLGAWDDAQTEHVGAERKTGVGY